MLFSHSVAAKTNLLVFTHNRGVYSGNRGDGGCDLARLEPLLHALELLVGLYESWAAGFPPAAHAGGLFCAAYKAVLLLTVLK